MSTSNVGAASLRSIVPGPVTDGAPEDDEPESDEPESESAVAVMSRYGAPAPSSPVETA